MTEELPKKLSAHDKAELILKMTKEAKMLERSLHAEAVIVIAMFKDGSQVTVQDAGRFPMPPAQFYDVLVQAHTNGMLTAVKNKPKKILRPN